MAFYSTKSNCVRAAKAAGLNPATLIFSQDHESGWTWSEPQQTRPPAGGVAALIELLKRPEGASIAEVVERTGWKPHTTRARISATVGKQMGHKIVTRKDAERGRIYQIDQAA